VPPPASAVVCRQDEAASGTKHIEGLWFVSADLGLGSSIGSTISPQFRCSFHADLCALSDWHKIPISSIRTRLKLKTSCF